MSTAEYIYVALAAIAAGAINAIAGGGSLITFPTLVAVGLTPITANVTNTIALCLGYLGATVAQRRDLAGQGKRAALLLPVAVAAGVAGALLLLHTNARTFDIVVPFLILTAALLVGAQDWIRRLLFREKHDHSPAIAIAPIAIAGLYGGYFGGGMGVMILASLAIVLSDDLLRLNALKQCLSLSVNVAAAVVFAFSGRIDWTIAGVMLFAALAGGVIGGKLSAKLPAKYLRWLIVAFGVVLSIIYFAKALRA